MQAYTQLLIHAPTRRMLRSMSRLKHLVHEARHFKDTARSWLKPYLKLERLGE